MFEWKAIEEANSSIKTTDIKGKDYAEVNQRIKAFRKICPNGLIKTIMHSLNDGIVIFRCEVYDEEGKLLSTGTAYEKEGSTFINRTSYIENCETSAVGRALGMLGLGIDVSIASYEEVQNAINNQNKPENADSKKSQRSTSESNPQQQKDTSQYQKAVWVYHNMKNNEQVSNVVTPILRGRKISSLPEKELDQIIQILNGASKTLGIKRYGG